MVSKRELEVENEQLRVKLILMEERKNEVQKKYEELVKKWNWQVDNHQW